MSFAIVVIAYNRPHALARLLGSLEAAQENAPELPWEVPLVISIDKSDDAAVPDLAEGFKWRLGDKIIIRHEENLGLKKHILCSGDLVEKFGNVVMLEDDLCVSPYFWRYISDSIAMSAVNDDIAQVSLYSNVYNETAELSFTPFNDGYDNYYMRIPSSWGQIWTVRQWREFKAWLPGYDANRDRYNALLPPNVKVWPETSWKKIFQAYVIDRAKVILYPRISMTTNFADAGVHHVGGDFHFQTQLLMYDKKSYNFSSPIQSNSIYDEYSERCDEFYLAMLKARFGISDIVIDLYGTKCTKALFGRYLFTTQEVDGEVLARFPMGLRPHELNVSKGVAQEDGVYKLLKIREGAEVISKQPSVESCKRLLYYHGIPDRVFRRESLKLQPRPQSRPQPMTKKQALKVLLPDKLVTFLKRVRGGKIR